MDAAGFVVTITTRLQVNEANQSVGLTLRASLRS
jgi:hypothetical protein